MCLGWLFSNLWCGFHIFQESTLHQLLSCELHIHSWILHVRFCKGLLCSHLETVVFLKIFLGNRKGLCVRRVFSKLQRKLLGNDSSPFVLTKSMRVTQPFTAGANKNAGEWWDRRWKGEDKRSLSSSSLFITVNYKNTQYQCLALGKAFVDSSEGLKEIWGTSQAPI